MLSNIPKNYSSVYVLNPNNQKYFPYISAPLYQQVCNWFRKEKKIFIGVDWSGRPQIIDINKDSYGKLLAEVCINKKYAGFEYYQALNAAIEEALKLI